MNLLFRQLYDVESGTFTYLLADEESHAGIIIDPVYEQLDRDLALIRELGINLSYCVETHCHADHVTAAWLLRNETDCRIAATAESNIEGLDLVLQHDDGLDLGNFNLQVLATPGHTPGCISLYLADPAMVFTGDCLLIRGCGRTDFQTGSAAELYHSITSKLFKLEDETIVYPGHDYKGRTMSTIGEERRLNPRIGGDANEQDFTGFLDNMQLPHPKKFDTAVPANLKMGQPGTMPIAPS